MMRTCTKRSNDWCQNNKERQLENVRRNNQTYRDLAKDYVFSICLNILVDHAVSLIPVFLSFTMKATKKPRSAGSWDVVLLEMH